MLRHVTHLQSISVVSNGYINNKRSVNVQGLRTPDILFYDFAVTHIHTHIHMQIWLASIIHRLDRTAKFRNLFQPLRRALICRICRDIPIPMPPVTNRMNNQVDLEQWRWRTRRSETQFSVSRLDRAQKRNNRRDLRARDV